MLKPEVCPVCEGRGLLPSNFYNIQYRWSSTSLATEVTSTVPCRSCDGKGYILIDQTSNNTRVSEETYLGGCAICMNNDGVAYMSNPPMYKCTIDGLFRCGQESCPNYKSPLTKSLNEYLEPAQSTKDNTLATLNMLNQVTYADSSEDTNTSIDNS